MKRKLVQMFLLGIMAFGFLVTALPAAAEDAQPPCGNNPNDPLALDCVGGSGLTKNDPRLVASRIINIVLGILGTIATVLIFYAGFLWMTAAGNDDQITKAKSIMSAAVIGLVLILASYSISTFFIKSAYKAVNDTTYVGP